MTAEVITLPEARLQFIDVKNPLDPRQREMHSVAFEPGQTLAQVFPESLKQQGRYVYAINGNILETEQELLSTVVTHGAYVTRIPMVEGDDAKNILRIAALIVVAIYAPEIAAKLAFEMGGGMFLGSAQGLALLTVGVQIAGAMLVNALLPPAKPPAASGGALTDDSPTYGVDGPKNTSAEGLPVPVVFGTHRYGGNIVSNYIVNEGENQILYMLINAGEGPIAGISEIELDDQPITNYSDAEYITRDGRATQSAIGWFGDTTTPRSVNQVVTDAYKFFTTIGEVDRLRIDFVAPSGLFYARDDGGFDTVSVPIEIQYRKITGGSPGPWQNFVAANTVVDYDVEDQWIQTTVSVPEPWGDGVGGSSTTLVDYVPTGSEWLKVDSSGTGSGTWYKSLGDYTGGGIWMADQYVVGTRVSTPIYGTTSIYTMESASRNPVRRSVISPQLPEGIYEIRYKRNTAPTTDPRTADAVTLVDVNEIITEDVTYKHTALLAIKAKINDQLSRLPNVTFMHGGILMNVFNEATGLWDFKASGNPAWMTWAILTNTRWGAGSAINRMDLAKWREWAKYCDERELTFSGVFDTQTNVWDAANAVARCGHAQVIQVGTRYSVVIEKAEVPTMMFTAANIVKGTFKENWLPMSERANEIEVSFADRNDKFRRRSIRLYDQISLAAGEPTRTANLQIMGLVDAERAYAEADMMLKLNRYIQRTIEFQAPIEAVACTVGDVVLVQHDMPQWGYGGRFDVGNTFNYVPRSQEFNVDWTLNRVRTFTTGGSVVNATNAPDGTMSAEKIVENTQTGTHGVNRDIVGTVPDNATVTLSIYAKAAERTWCQVQMQAKDGTFKAVRVNLTTGEVGTTTAGYIGRSEDAGNGWWRVSLTGSVQAGATTPRFNFLINLNGSTNNWTGDNTSGLFIWGAQFEVADTPSVYVRTEANIRNILRLDRPVPVEELADYLVLVHYPALQRFQNTVLSIAGNVILLTGYTGTNWGEMRLKRTGSTTETEVLEVVQSGANWGVRVASTSGFSSGQSVELWQTNAIVTSAVWNPLVAGDNVREYTTIGCDLLPQQPVTGDKWMFGKVNKVAKPFRVRQIAGSHEYTRDLICIEYNEAIYTPGAEVPDLDYSDLNDRLVQLPTDVVFTEKLVINGKSIVPQVTVSWRSTQSSYLNATVLVSTNKGPWEDKGTHFNQITFMAAEGDQLRVRFIAYDRFGNSTPSPLSDFDSYTVLGKTAPPSAVTGLVAVIKPSQVQINWELPPDLDYETTELRVGGTWASGTPLVSPGPTRSNTGQFNWPRPANGTYTIRARHRDTSGNYSPDGATTTIVVDSSIDATGTPGAAAISAILTPESLVLPADAAGNVTSYANATSFMKVYVGTTDDTGNWTISKNAETAGITSTVTAGVVTITAFPNSVDTGFVELIATKAGSSNLIKRLQIAKAKSGGAGASAQSLALRASSQTFTYDSTGAALPTSQTITFTALPQNLSGTTAFTCTRYNSAGTVLGTVTLGGTGNSRTLTNTQFGNANYAVVEATLGGITDQITVVRLRDGAAGAAGQNAVVGFLTNETYAVPCDSSGNVVSGGLTSATGTFKVFNGLTDVTAGAIFQVIAGGQVNCTGSINASGVYSVTNITADTAELRLRATFGTVSIDKDFTLSKVRSGANGADATFIWMTSSAGVARKNAAGTAVTPDSLTFSAFSRVGSGAPATYAGRFIIATSTDGTSFTNVYTSAANESSTTFTVPTNVQIVRARLYLAGGTTELVQEIGVPVVSDGAAGSPGATGVSAATVSLWQWSSVAPADPTANTSYNWGTGAHTGTPDNGWSTTIPANPGTPTLQLWVASKTISAPAGSTTSTVTWTPGSFTKAAVGANGQSGPNGSRYAVVRVFQWAPPPAPAISGAATYTWASGAVNFVPAGWATSPGTSPSAGFNLYQAEIRLIDAATSVTSAIDWATATISIVGYAGTNGAAAKAVSLTANGQAFRTDQNGTTSPTSIVLTAVGQNLTGSPTFSTSPAVTLTGTGNSRTLSFANFGSNNAVTVTVDWDGVSDSLTIYRLREGDSAVTPILSNAAHVVPATNAGVVSSYAGSGTTIQVFEGGTALQFNTVLSAGRFTVGTPIVSPSGALVAGARSGSGTDTATVAAHSAMSSTEDVVTVTYPITARRSNGVDTIFNVVQTITKSRAGATGSTGGAGAQGASSRVAYAKAAVSSLNTTPTSTQTTGATSFPATNTWGGGEVWQATPPVPTAGEWVFQLYGVYDPVSNLTTWGVPFVATFRVGQLSALSADLGTVTAGSVNIGAGNAVIPTSGLATFKGLRIEDEEGNVVLETRTGSQTLINSDWLNVQIGTDNLLRNSGFEAGTTAIATSWATNGSGTGQVATPTHSTPAEASTAGGVRGQRAFTTAMSDRAGVTMGYIQSDIPSTALRGKTVCFSVDAYIAVTGAQRLMNLLVQSVDGSNAVSAAFEVFTEQLSATRTRFTVKGVVPGNSVTLRAVARCRSNSTGTHLSITGGTANGSAVTLNFTSQPSAPFAIGSTIEVNNNGLAAINGLRVVTGCTTTSVTFASTATGTVTAAGTVNSAREVTFTIDDAKLEVGDLPTSYSTGMIDKIGLDNPLNDSNKVDFGFTGDLNATRNVVTRSATPPASPADGDIWIETDVTPNVTYTRVGGAWQATASLGATFNPGAVGAIQGAIDAGNVDDYVAVGVLKAKHIAAESITASRLVLTDTSNIYPDFDILDPDFYTSSAGSSFTLFGTSSTNYGKNQLRLTSTASNSRIETGWFPITQDADYWVEAGCFLPTPDGSTVRVRLELAPVLSTGLVDTANIRTVQVAERVNSSNGSRQAVEIVTATDEKAARFVCTRTAGTQEARYGGFMVRRRMNSDLIVDGSVTATKIDVVNLAAINAELGNAVISTTGSLRSGQTAFNVGNGFWLGIDGGVPKFSIGSNTGNRLTWDGTDLSINVKTENQTVIGVRENCSTFDFDIRSGGATATATVSYLRNGTCVGGLAWFQNGSSTTGDDYWIKVSRSTAASAVPTSGALDVWLRLNTTRTWSLQALSGQVRNSQLNVQISTSSTGTPVVASGFITLNAESYSGIIP